MTEFGDLFPRFAHQHIDKMAHTKTLPGAIDRRQQLPCRLGRILQGRWIEAIVAIAARRRAWLTEIFEKRDAAAAAGFEKGDQRPQSPRFLGLARFIGIALRDKAACPGDIFRPPEQLCHRGVAIAAGATGFLIIGLDRFWQTDMGDKAHIGLVDAHAEGDRRDHHHVFGFDEIGLVARPRSGIEPGVIGTGIDPILGKPARDLIGDRPRRRIDDPRPSGL